MTRWFPLLAGALLALPAAAAPSPPAVAALPAAAALNDAEGLYARQQFAQALALLDRAGKELESGPMAVRALDLTARCQVALKNPERAERAFLSLLALDPHWVPDRTQSPKILAAFDAAKLSRFPARVVTLQPPRGDGRAVAVVDPWGLVARTSWTARAAGAGPWNTRDLSVEGHEVRLPAGVQVGRPTEWYLTAFDAQGQALATLGSAEAPLRLSSWEVAQAVPAVELRTPEVRSRALPWTATGVAVAVGAAAAIFQLQSSASARAAEEEPWSDTGRTLHQGSMRQARWATGLLIGAGVSGALAAVLWAL